MKRSIDDEFSEYVAPHIWNFKPESVSDLMLRPEPVIEWLIESLWVDKSRGLIAGNPGVGKTWMALEMLFSVASGTPCLGRFAVKQGAVLLVEEESSVMNLARRVHCMARGRGILGNELSNFYHLTRQFIKIPKHERELIGFIKAHEIKLVVFDSLRRFHGVDENSSDKMQPILDSFARINIEAETSVVLIHHLSKQKDEKNVKKPVFERMRGTSDLWAWRDCIIGIEGVPDETTASCSFQFRDAESPKPILIKRDIDAVSGAVALNVQNIEDSEEFTERSSAILDYLKEHQPASKDTVCAGSKGRKQINARVFDMLVEKGLIVKHGFKWELPESSINGTQ